MRRRAWQLTTAIFLLSGGVAFAQGLLPSSGSIFPSPDNLSHRHMSPYGKPCLTFKAYAKPEGATASLFGPMFGRGQRAEPSATSERGAITAPKIYEHGINIRNECGQNIKVQVCYYKSDNCIKLIVPPWGEKEGVLGIYAGEGAFRYQAKEQFP